jgi:penicillin G amidase
MLAPTRILLKKLGSTVREIEESAMRHAAAFVLVLLVSSLIPSPASVTAARERESETFSLKGLRGPVRVVKDADGIPTIFASDDHDAIMTLGFLHAEDRLFQMDILRRQLNGTLSELIGSVGLTSDITFRAIGLYRAAEESLPAYSANTRALLDAYADGVNAYLADANNPLPPEYGGLELTRAGIPAWRPVDIVLLAKGLTFQQSFDFREDIDTTSALAAYQQAAQAGGFDGTALFFEDCYRFAPFDPSFTVPNFIPGTKRSAAPLTETMRAARTLSKVLEPGTIEAARSFVEATRKDPYLSRGLGRDRLATGSNWWAVHGSKTTSGAAMLASDPHLDLPIAPVFYEAHVVVENDPQLGPMNVAGVSFAGTPLFVLGYNERIAWGLTYDPLDCADVYQEKLKFSITKQRPSHTYFDGKKEKLRIVKQVYRANNLGDQRQDNISKLTTGVSYVVPRRNNGPIVAVNLTGGVNNITGVSVQHSAWRATRDIETFAIWARARTFDDFKRGMEFLDTPTLNASYADVEGNIGYLTSGEIAVREDLQTLNRPDGLPPLFIRDGTHTAKNEWLSVQNPQPNQSLAFEILPAAEMPHAFNPPWGYLANANNDPIGSTLDNDIFNQLRPGGGLHYLVVPYEGGFREGRIVRLLDDALANGKKVSVDDMMRIQANNQMLDAEMLVPYIRSAFANGRAQGAPSALAALANDGRVVEAVNRFAGWDFGSPTGIREGYDPGDDPENLQDPSPAEIQRSVAATIYAMWRSRMLANVIDGTLARVGVGTWAPPPTLALSALRNLLDTFASKHGVGASGLNFFQVDGAPSPDAARDIVILRSLVEGLDALAGPSYEAAFARSTNQSDYRWGKLHRIVFDHPLGAPFNVPNAGGFSDVGPGLRGVAKAGGFAVVDAAGYSARASGIDDFMFTSGPGRRFVGEMSSSGPSAFEIIPGGQSGVVSSPLYANQLGRWLTDRYHPLPLDASSALALKASERVFLP